MKNFKKGGFNKGGNDFGGRPKFGGDRGFGAGGGDRDRDGGRGFSGGRPELFSAICSSCGKPCELPFRPTGERPVFCRDCFDKKDDARGHSSFERTDRSREFRAPSREHAHGSDNADLKKQIANLEYKMDKIIKMLESTTSKEVATPKVVVKEVVAEAAPVAKPAPVKEKAAAPAKKVAAKKAKAAPAKKAAKKK